MHIRSSTARETRTMFATILNKFDHAKMKNSDKKQKIML